MNAGVSSRGSPMPKSMHVDARGRAAARLASVSRTNGYVRRPAQDGGEAHAHAANASQAARWQRTSAAIATDSSRRCACAGSPGPKLTASMPGRAELGDRRPGLLGRDREAAARDQRCARRVRGGDRPGRRVGVDQQLAARAQLAQPRLGLRRAAAGRVAVVDVRLGAVGDHVAGDPAGDLRHRGDLAEDEAVELVRLGLVARRARRSRRAARWIALSASHGRAECPERPWKRPGRVDVAEAAGVDRVVGRLHHHHELGGDLVAGARQQRRQRALGDRQLLAPEEQARRTARPASASSIITASAPFMSLAPRPWTRSSSRRPGRLSCAGHGVEVPGEQHRRPRPRRAGQDAGVAEVGTSRPPPAGRPRRGPRAPPRRATRTGCRPARASGRRGGRRARRRRGPRTRPETLHWVGNCRRPETAARRRPAPPGPAKPGRAKQRAFFIAALPEGDDLAELRELLRTAGVATVGEVVQHRDKPHPNLYLGPGKVDELKARAQGGGRQRRRRRRRAHPAPGAQPREGARPAGARPHHGDPRHLRRPRPLGRGQAPGRARPARVQHGPHARPVDAPRASRRRPRRRRHRHPRPGRVADRDRPPARARPHHRAAPPARARSRTTRATQRAERERAHLPAVALAGYTNAGKSTLLNALTGADVGVRDRLFHTLDPTTRTTAPRGPHLPDDRHRRLHPQAAAPARRRLRRDARGDQARRPAAARRRRQRARGGARADDPRGRRRARGDRRRRRAAHPRAQQGRRARRRAPPRARRFRHPDAVARLRRSPARGSTSCGERIARRVRAHAARRRAARAVLRGRHAVRAARRGRRPRAHRHARGRARPGAAPRGRRRALRPLRGRRQRRRRRPSGPRSRTRARRGRRPTAAARRRRRSRAPRRGPAAAARCGRRRAPRTARRRG